MIWITLCSTNESMYMVSCDYVRGCGRENCSYNLTSVNNSLTDTIQGSSLIRITDQEVIYNLTVTDMDEIMVQSEEFSFSDVRFCPTATGYISLLYYILLIIIMQRQPCHCMVPRVTQEVASVLLCYSSCGSCDLYL